MDARSEDDDFTLVSSKKRNKKSTNFVRTNPQNLTAEESVVDKSTAIRRILSAKTEILESDYFASLCATLREGLSILGNPEVKESVCYGLGHVCDCMISRYQLALLLCLKEQYNIETFVHDPIFYAVEKQILTELGFTLIGVNEEGKRIITQGVPTILFFPHCSKQLTNNFLWANWDPKNLKECILICNSFTKLIETTSKRILGKEAAFILNISPYVDEICIINTFKFSDIFNNISVHVFQEEKLRLIDPDFWSCAEPKYESEDVEFILNSLDNLHVLLTMATKLTTLRKIISELRLASSSGKVTESLQLQYILSQYRKYQTTDQQLCKAQQEVNFVAQTYLCYLTSVRKYHDIYKEYHGRGERTVAETARLVGFKLPHDPK